jgi:hypothetical protein
VRPQRGITAAQNRSATNRDAIGKVYFMACRNDAAVTQQETRIDGINDVWFRDGIYFVHANDLGITSKVNFVATSDDIQVSNVYMIPKLQLLNPNYQIKMPNSHVIIDPALFRIDDAQSDAHSLSNSITKEQTITGALEKRGQQCDKGQQDESGFS